MTTEHLIEKAAKALFADDSTDSLKAETAPEIWDLCERFARITLAVFEEAHTVTDGSVNVTARHSTSVTNSEAHTPTNDEREALANRVQLGYVTDWYEAADL